MQSAMFAVGVVGALGMGLFHGCQTPAKCYSQPMAVAPRPLAAEQQIARGGAVYARQCAACHGGAGQGTADAPAVVGAAALPRMPRPDSGRQTEFRTALDVAVFVTQNMPPDESRRRAIAEQDYWSILAFALSANGVPLSQVVTPQNAGQIVLRP